MLTQNLRSWSAALVSAVAAIGCGGVDSHEGDGTPDVDTEAPVVASSLPAPQATGVAAGDKIVITFSEPMDVGTVEQAYQSTDLPFDAVSTSWNADLTVLTISPDAPLYYAAGTGNDPTVVTPKTYAITIGAGAADLAGNALGSDFELTFATKRRMSTAAGLFSDLTRVMLEDTFLGVSNDIWIGDNDLDQRYLALVSFDLQKLPASATIESATFASRQLAPTGLPYNMGAVMAYHLASATLENFVGIAPTALPTAYSMDGISESKSLDVTGHVADDVVHRAERGNLSQYRIQIDAPTDKDTKVDKASFSLATFEMSIVYIAD